MLGILSAVSGQFTKYLILGTLLPVAIFVALALVFGRPILPASLPFVRDLATLDKQWFTLTLIATTVVASGLLCNLNTPIIRFYEGYPWRGSVIGTWQVNRLQKKLDRAIELRERMRVTQEILRENKADANLVARLQLRRTRVSVLVRASLPSRNQILPTRLGNAIKSFEEYSFLQYGMDAIIFWPRIIAVAPKEYLSGIDDSKTSLDFFLNSSFLSAVASATLLLTGLAFKRPFANDATLILWSLEVAGLAVSSWLFYRSSVGRAAAWGELVKGTFDLYRWNLLKQLGYSQTPRTRQYEREIWTEISQQIVYRDPADRPPLPYDQPIAVVAPNPPSIRLQVAYGMKKSTFGQNLSFVCEITNLDSTKTDLLLLLTPQKGWHLVWGSASVQTKHVATSPMMRSNMQFDLGSLASKEKAVFTCALMPLPTPEIEESHESK